MTKRITIILCTALAAVLLAPLASAQQQSDKDIYAQAVAEYNGKKWAEAEKNFAYLAKRYPQHAKIRYYLNNSRLNARTAKVPAGTVEGDLSKIVLPQINLQGASLDLVFEFLSAKTTELSGGKVAANFIYKGSKENRDLQNISLNLSNIPVTEVIRYVGEISGTHFKYERHAIVGTPRSEMAVPVAAEPKKKDPFAPAPPDPFA